MASSHAHHGPPKHNSPQPIPPAGLLGPCAGCRGPERGWLGPPGLGTRALGPGGDRPRRGHFDAAVLPRRIVLAFQVSLERSSVQRADDLGLAPALVEGATPGDGAWP